MTETNLDIVYPMNSRDLLVLESRKPAVVKSTVWQYFGVFDDDKHPLLKGSAICYKCLKFLKCNGSTSSLQNHTKSVCLSDERSSELLEEVSTHDIVFDWKDCTYMF